MLFLDNLICLNQRNMDFFFFVVQYLNILEEEREKYIYLRVNFNFSDYVCIPIFFFLILIGEQF